jgi:small conductance mechanosensitive channel
LRNPARSSGACWAADGGCGNRAAAPPLHRCCVAPGCCAWRAHAAQQRGMPMETEIATWWSRYSPLIVDGAIKIAAAFVLYLAGRWLIGFAIDALRRVLTARNFDPTLQRYIANILGVVLNILLVVAILGYFGLQTTSFAALLAGVGLAIGAAWSGMLGNFAAGAFLIIFRPYKVGDYVEAGGVEGTVVEIGMFNTVINTPDNVLTTIGNGKITGETLKNYAANPYRRVNREAQLAFGVDPLDAIERLRPRIAEIPNVLATPAPDIEIIDFNERGTLLCVRPHCHTDHYWQVWFDTNRAIARTFADAGYPAPFTIESER